MVELGIVSPQYMDIAFSIEMVIWVAVGGRATLVGAILGAVLVNWARTLLSESFPEVWLFFQGALFLLVVTALPDGIVGWLRSQFGDRLRTWLGPSRLVVTPPLLELDPDMREERREAIDKR